MGGGGHHGGGHHGGHGGGVSLVPYGYNWGQPDWYEPTSVVVVGGGAADPDAVARATAYIMSLPKAQRGYAYKKIFGKAPPKGALGDLSTAIAQMDATGYLVLAVAAYVIYKLLKGKG